MLSPEENEFLCRVGPGTPMGDLMRQYWLPLLISRELPEADCPPLRVRVLGENLIAFRTTSGRVGLIQNNCMHRGASLFFGRNEGEGLRCVYHGWKYDVTGQCVDMPNEPAESNFKSKIRAIAYPCVERGGVIWTYMGPRQARPAAKGDPDVTVELPGVGPVSGLPPLPELEPNLLPASECSIQKVFRECNWAQGIEGEIDTSHFGFLHMGAVKPEDTPPESFDRYTVVDRAPRYHVLDTEAGTSYGAYRPAEEGSSYWRIAHFLFPFFTMIPTGELGKQLLVRAWVPLDDEHVMFWSIGALSGRAGPGMGAAGQVMVGGRPAAAAGGRGPDFEFLPDTTDWLGRFRLTQNKTNDYLIDREAQRVQSFTGISGIGQQDQAITESMGPIFDRTKEHLGSSDAMVMRTRRRLMDAARALRDHGVIPPGVDEPEIYRMRSGGIVLPNDVDGLTATRDLQTAFAKR